ncbi:hypothetical protein BDW75DRAFT_29522 [Aspergillus navahoensis]
MAPSEEPPAQQPRTASKRSEYVHQACITCRKRKVKCTGGPSCAECNKLGEPCVYTDQRRKSRVQRNPTTASSTGLSDNVVQLNARLAELEAHCSRLKTFISSASQPPIQASPESDFASNPDPLLTTFDPSVHIPVSPTSPTSPIPSAPSGPPVAAPSSAPAPAPAPAHTAPAHSAPASVSNHFPAPAPAPALHSPALSFSQQPPQHHSQPCPEQPRAVSPEISRQMLAVSPPVNLNTEVAGILESLARPAASPARLSLGGINVARAQQKVCLNNGASIRPVFDMFFRLLNPLHPILNENQFRSQFDNLVFYNGQNLGELDRLQFLALVLLVNAEVNLLDSHSADPVNASGWDEFCTAEGILANVIWKDTANLLTVQCLLIKTRYLTYLQRLHQAHDTMAVVVRICLMIGLHDQSRWTLQGADPCEIVIRQRVFWSVFTLERCVSLSCGMPPTLRAADCLVDLPQLLDDRSVVPNCPLPGETPELSFIPYLRALVAWGELWGEVWEDMFSVRAILAGSAERIALLDTKILAKLEELPMHLQWSPTSASGMLSGDRVEPWVLRQRVMYITRMHALRLLIRQEQMYKTELDSQVAKEIGQIAGDSVRVMEDYIRSGGQPIDRYFLSTYLSALIVPLSCLIVKEKADPDLREQAVALWRKTVLLLEELSWSFGQARLLLKRFEGVIKAVGSVIAPAETNGVTNPEQTTNSSSRVTAEEAALESGFTHISGSQDASEEVAMEFSALHFHGMASDPDLWRVITW